MVIKLDNFKGVAPKIEPHLLPVQAGQIAQNCKLGSGGLEPYKGLLFSSNLSKVGTKLSLFRYKAASVWFHWITDVDAVDSPIANDPYARVYFTGDTGGPKMTANDIATAGQGTDYPNNSYLLGLPDPLAAPTCTVGGTITNEDPSLVESRTYIYTYVSVYGEEGPPSDASLVVDVAPGQYVDLSGMSTSPNGNYNVTQKRIYRVNKGSATTEYQIVATVPVANTTYHDTVASEALGAVLVSTTWFAPPSGLKGLTPLPCGSLAGFVGNELCVSVPYQPHAWPLEYRLSFDSEIVGIGAYGNYILVSTTGMPHVVILQDPSAMTAEKLESGQSCVSKRGVVDMGYSVMYPAPDGLMMVASGRVDMVTEGIFDRDDWQALSPSSMAGYRWNDLYVGFYNNGTPGGFVFDPETKDFAFVDVSATAGYADQATGKLYLVGSDGKVSEWDAGSALTLTWESKAFLTEAPLNMGAAQVKGSSYPITFKVYADGVLKHTQAVADGKPFRLPGGYLAEKWEFSVSSSGKIQSVSMAPNIANLAS
jgi:hypothetical protein